MGRIAHRLTAYVKNWDESCNPHDAIRYVYGHKRITKRLKQRFSMLKNLCRLKGYITEAQFKMLATRKTYTVESNPKKRGAYKTRKPSNTVESNRANSETTVRIPKEKDRLLQAEINSAAKLYGEYNKLNTFTQQIFKAFLSQL